MLNQAFVLEQALLPKRVRCSLQIDRIPKHDSSGKQVESARTVALLFDIFKTFASFGPWTQSTYGRKSCSKSLHALLKDYGYRVSAKALLISPTN